MMAALSIILKPFPVKLTYSSFSSVQILNPNDLF